MGVSAFQIGSPRRAKEGIRIGVVRYLPRGVRKDEYSKLDLFDIWLPILAPSRKLLRSFKSKGWTSAVRKAFFQKYEKELLSSTDSRQAIELLRTLGKKVDISVGCYCADEKLCHRSVLLPLIKQISKRK